MTVLAYRAGIIASDSVLVDNGTMCGAGRKLARGPDGTIAGACGSCGISHRFLQWIEAGEPDDFDPDTQGNEFGAIVVRPDGSTWRMSASGVIWPSTAPFFTDGCGSDIAMGALEMGATAEQAVAAAIKWDCNCGGDIQVERLVCNERRSRGARMSRVAA